MNLKIIDKVAFIYFQDEKILMARTRGKNVFYIPGGKREKGEQDLDVLLREVKEELNVEIIPSSVALYGVFEAQAHGMPQGVIVRLRCYTADFTGTLTPHSEIEEIDFFSYSQRTQVGPVDQLVFDTAWSQKLLR